MATEKHIADNRKKDRLIDAGDLWSDIMMLPHNGDIISSEEVEQAIKDAPTVDAVEVVRCGVCKMYKTTSCSMYSEYYPEWYPKYTDFCSYGERRNDGSE